MKYTHDSGRKKSVEVPIIGQVVSPVSVRSAVRRVVRILRESRDVRVRYPYSMNFRELM